MRAGVRRTSMRRQRITHLMLAGLLCAGCTSTRGAPLPISPPMRAALADAHIVLSAPHGRPTTSKREALLVAGQGSGSTDVTQTFLATAQVQRVIDAQPIRRLAWVIGYRLATLADASEASANATQKFMIVDAHELIILGSVTAVPAPTSRPSVAASPR